MNYILKGKTPVKCSSTEEWAIFFEDIKNRRVAETELGGVRVSTVFLGIDHSFGQDGPPLLFETMIFGGEHDEMTWRHSTWDEAEEGHNRACLLAGVSHGS